MSSPHFAALLTCTGYVVDDVQKSFKDYVNRIKIDRSIIHLTKAQFSIFSCELFRGYDVWSLSFFGQDYTTV